MLGAFFQIKALQAPLLLKFPLNCQKRTKNMTSKNKETAALWFWWHFCKIKAHTAILRRYSRILHRFPRIFARIFTKSKLLGVCLHPLHPRLLHQWLAMQGRTRKRKCPVLRQQLHTKKMSSVTATVAFLVRKRYAE